MISKKEYDKEYYDKNKERINLRNNIYYQKHREEMIEQHRDYNKGCVESRRKYQKNYYQEHKKELNDYVSNRLKTNICCRLSHNLRHRLNKVLKGNYKSGSAVRDLGCSAVFLRDYLSLQFKTGMNWENYGKEWSIDHVQALSNFDLTNREQFLEASNYKNLQPLWIPENISKGNRVL